jgi:Lrp/AsnC family transcriptional regulator for asnA, asnC and gidA
MPLAPKIDETDKAIIRLLQQDGRRSYTDIANELSLSPSNIQQRVRRLMEANLLTIRAVTDPVALGVMITATVAVKVDTTRIRQAAAEMADLPEVGYVAICTGPYDVLIEVACEDQAHLLRFLADKLGQIEGVHSTEVFVYLQIVKNNYVWGLPP